MVIINYKGALYQVRIYLDGGDGYNREANASDVLADVATWDDRGYYSIDANNYPDGHTIGEVVSDTLEALAEAQEEADSEAPNPYASATHQEDEVGAWYACKKARNEMPYGPYADKSDAEEMAQSLIHYEGDEAEVYETFGEYASRHMEVAFSETMTK